MSRFTLGILIDIHSPSALELYSPVCLSIKQTNKAFSKGHIEVGQKDSPLNCARFMQIEMKK